MGALYHVHMERPDPMAPSTRHVWRAWVSGDAIVTEEGIVAGSYRRVELTPDRWEGRKPVDHLQELISSHLSDGWDITLKSEDACDYPTLPPLMYFQIKGGASAEVEAQFLLKLARALPTEQCEHLDWINPQQLKLLKDGVKPVRWEAELQVGRERITFKAGNGRKVVMSAAVREGSIAAKLLMIIMAAAQDQFSATVSDEDGNGIEAKGQLEKSGFISLEEFKELAYALGTIRRPVVMASYEPSNSELAPVFF